MNTKQRIKLNMYLAVRNFGNQNDAVAKSIPKFGSNFDLLKSTIDEIQVIGEMQGINKTGLAIDKNKLKKLLIAMAVKYSNRIAILAKSNNNDTLLKEVRLNESELGKLPGVTLKDRVQNIYDKADANIDNLSEQGITPDTQKQFLDAITAFNNALATPRSGIAEKRKATQKLPVLFDTADSLIEIMDLAARSAKDDQPDFYNGYKTSRKLVDTNTGGISLKASAKELTSGEPVHGAIFTFSHEADKLTGSNGTGEIIKKTTSKGNFHIKSMKAGNYKIVVSKPGYKDKEAAVIIADGERSDLNVEMEKA
jgi:Carboxypeptidase regulatory-like domain